MAALTSCCYSKLEELEAQLNSEMSFFGQPQTNLTEQEEQEQEQQKQMVAPVDYYINGGDDSDQVVTELLGFDSNFCPSDKFVDDLFLDSHSSYNKCNDNQAGEYSSFYTNNNCNFQCNNSSLLPPPYYSAAAAAGCTATTSSSSSSPPEIFPAVNYEYDDNDHLLQMKRQKLLEEERFNCPDIDCVVPNMSFFDEPCPGAFNVDPFLDYHFAYNPLPPLPPVPPPPPPPVVPFLPYYYYYNNNNSSNQEAMEYCPNKIPAAGTGSSSNSSSSSNNNGGGGGGGNLSTQSIAARQRRRKITEKTQELGKLIPGGHRMNTADMFQAASKYIKFLQAQVGILQTSTTTATATAGSSPPPPKEEINGDSMDNHRGIAELLLGSTLIQEKLYSTEQCLVPKKLADDAKSLPNHHRHHHHNLKLDQETI